MVVVVTHVEISRIIRATNLISDWQIITVVLAGFHCASADGFIGPAVTR